MAEDQGKEEEKFDFTSEGEGYISLDEARVLAVQTAVASPGEYGRDFRRVTMVFDVVESTETDDHYMVTLSVRPQGNFDGTPGQEQFVVGKEGTIAVRQVLSTPIQTSASQTDTASNGGGFPILPVAIGVVIVGVIAAISAAVILMGSSDGDGGTTQLVIPADSRTPVYTQIPGALITPTEQPALIPTPTSRPTNTPSPSPSTTPTTNVILVTPTPTMRPTLEPTLALTPKPTPPLELIGEIAFGETKQGTLIIGEWDFSKWTFNGVEGQIVKIDARGKTNSLDPSIRLIAPSGIREEYNDDVGIGFDAQIITRLNQSGTYTIEVGETTIWDEYHGLSGNYEISLNVGVLRGATIYDKGVEYYNSENWAMAIEELTMAIQLSPYHSNVYWYRGNAYRELTQYQNAINDYDEAITLNSDNAVIFNDRALAHHYLGQYQYQRADEATACSLDSKYC